MQKPKPFRSLFSWFSKPATKPTNYSFKIFGSDTQLLELNLLPYQSIRVEPSSLLYHEPGITLDTKIMTNESSGVQRVISGSSLFVIDLTNENEKTSAVVGLSPNRYSQILHLEIDETQDPFYFVGDSFMCSSIGVDIQSKFYGLKMALVRKNMFVQRFTGKGSLFIKAGINVRDITLEDKDSIIVASNALLGFEESVKVSLSTNLHPQLMGTNNFFMLKLKGPGKVFFQSSSKEDFELSIAYNIVKGGVGIDQLLNLGAISFGGTSENPDETKVLNPSDHANHEHDEHFNHPDSHDKPQDSSFPESHDKPENSDHQPDYSQDNSDTTFDGPIDSNLYTGGPNE